MLGSLYRPSAVLYDGHTTHVLLEGHAADLAEQAVLAQLGAEVDGPPALPEGPHRGRISVPPAATVAAGRRLSDATPSARWLAEIGVGTVHVACDEEQDLVCARDIAQQLNGWLLREAGAPGLEGFGIPLPNHALMTRVKAAFDPDRRFAPGRLPL